MLYWSVKENTAQEERGRERERGSEGGKGKRMTAKKKTRRCCNHIQLSTEENTVSFHQVQLQSASAPLIGHKQI